MRTVIKKERSPLWVLNRESVRIKKKLSKLTACNETNNTTINNLLLTCIADIEALIYVTNKHKDSIKTDLISSRIDLLKFFFKVDIDLSKRQMGIKSDYKRIIFYIMVKIYKTNINSLAVFLKINHSIILKAIRRTKELISIGDIFTLSKLDEFNIQKSLHLK